MEDIFKQTLKALRDGRPVVWAVVSIRQGSSPRSVGSRMIVFEDGSIHGTIGGGRLEAEAMQAAREMFHKPRRRLINFNLTSAEVAETDMICGGKVDVMLEYVGPEDTSALEFLTELTSSPDNPALLVTRIDKESDASFGNSHAIVYADGRIKRGLRLSEEWARPYLPLRQTLTARLQDDDSLLLLEPLLTIPTLYIFGGGHVSLDLARLANIVDFRVAVMDDRPEYANRERFPFAWEILRRPYERATEGIVLDDSAFVVIVTRGHMHDLDVLRQVVGSDARYIGMIGSRRKRDLIYEQLRREGVDERRLERVHSPVGLSISAETPAEIAVSIVAELIQVKNAGSGALKMWKV